MALRRAGIHFLISILGVAFASIALASEAPSRSIYDRRLSIALIERQDADLDHLGKASAQSHFTGGIAAYERGDFELAVKEFKAGLDEQQTYALWHNYGAALLMLGDTGATPSITHGYDPEDGPYDYAGPPYAQQARDAYSVAAGWLAGRGKPLSYGLLRARADAQFDSEEYGLAEADYRAALATPAGVSDIDLLVNLGAAQFRADEDSDALATWKQAAQLTEQLGAAPAPDLLAKLGVVYSSTEDYEKALEFTLRANEATLAAGQPESADLWQLLCATYSRLERNEEGLAAAEKSARLRAETGEDPRPELAPLRGLFLLRLGRLSEAEQVFRDSIATAGKYSDESSVYILLGAAIFEQERPEDALVIYDEAIARAAANEQPAGQLYSMRAWLRLALGEYQGALADANAVADLEEPNDPDALAAAHLIQAVVLGSWGQFNTAQANLDAAGRSSEDPNLQAFLPLIEGALQYEMGQRADGCEKMLAALDRLKELGIELPEETTANLLQVCKPD